MSDRPMNPLTRFAHSQGRSARSAAALLWLERGLFALAAVLALWCAVRLTQTSYVRQMPAPTPTHSAGPGGLSATSLPGDPPWTVAASTPAPPVQGAWVARLEAPTVHMTATVLEGSDDGTLAKAAGHIEDTALPGERGNVGIAGHRDTIFRPVRNLHIGDPLVVTTSNRVLRYLISSTQIVNPDDVYVLDPTPRPALTLVTCYPFTFIGHAPKRYIVRADLVGEAPRTAAK